MTPEQDMAETVEAVNHAIALSLLYGRGHPDVVEAFRIARIKMAFQASAHKFLIDGGFWSTKDSIAPGTYAKAGSHDFTWMNANDRRKAEVSE